MSTRGTTAYDGDEGIKTPDWHVEPKPWCPSCCVPAQTCGCPEAERMIEAGGWASTTTTDTSKSG